MDLLLNVYVEKNVGLKTNIVKKKICSFGQKVGMNGMNKKKHIGRFQKKFHGTNIYKHQSRRSNICTIKTYRSTQTIQNSIYNKTTNIRNTIYKSQYTILY